MYINRVLLRSYLVKHFDANELKTLAYDLNINWGELAGETLSIKALSLITYMESRGQLHNLITYLEDTRPNINWSEIKTNQTPPSDYNYQFERPYRKRKYFIFYIVLSAILVVLASLFIWNTYISPPPYYFFIVDASLRMNDAFEDERKWDAAQKSVLHLLNLLPNNANYALLTLGNTNNTIHSCDQTDSMLLFPWGSSEEARPKITTAIPRGQSSLTNAITQGLDKLVSSNLPANAAKTLIIIIGGGDNCVASENEWSALESIVEEANNLGIQVSTELIILVDEEIDEETEKFLETIQRIGLNANISKVSNKEELDTIITEQVVFSLPAAAIPTVAEIQNTVSSDALDATIPSPVSTGSSAVTILPTTTPTKEHPTPLPTVTPSPTHTPIPTLTATPTHPPSTNQILKVDFEVNFQDWNEEYNLFGSSLARQPTSFAYQSSQAIEVIYTDANKNSSNANIELTEFPALAGKAYKVSAWCYAELDAVCTLWIGNAPLQSRPDNPVIGEHIPERQRISGNGQWQQITNCIELHQDDYLAVYMYAEAWNTTVVYDDIVVEEMSTCPTPIVTPIPLPVLPTSTPTETPTAISLPTPSVENLIGHWQFDECTNTQIIDSSGKSGTYTLGSGLSSVESDIQGCAMNFAEGGILIDHYPELSIEAGTIEVWAKIEALQIADIIFHVTDYDARRQRELSSNAGVYGLRILVSGAVQSYIGNADPNGEGFWIFASTTHSLIRANTWHHLAMRWNNETLDIFVDGCLKASQPYTPIPIVGLSYGGEYPLFVGMAGGGGGKFIGQLDDLRLYQSVRSNSEILAASGQNTCTTP